MPSRIWNVEGVPTIAVWDPFVRVFHWCTALLVLVAFLTTDDLRWLHEGAGYAVFGLAAVRILWGLFGGEYARFSGFLCGPRTLVSYLRSLHGRQAKRYLGHNPAGGLMIVALLTLLIVVSFSGWLSETNAYFGVPWVDHLHHLSAHLLLVLIGLHAAGVIVSSWLHGENLVFAMITGRKRLDVDGGAEIQGEHGTAAFARHGTD